VKKSRGAEKWLILAKTGSFGAKTGSFWAKMVLFYLFE
jgi:hypothetical protein